MHAFKWLPGFMVFTFTARPHTAAVLQIEASVQAAEPEGIEWKVKKNIYIYMYVCIFILATPSEAAVRGAPTCRVPPSEPSSSFQSFLISPHHLSSVCLPGSIAIIVPLVLLVILIVTVVVGVYICRRRQR